MELECVSCEEGIEEVGGGAAALRWKGHVRQGLVLNGYRSPPACLARGFCPDSSPGAHQPLTSALVCCLQSSDGVQQPPSPSGEKASIMLKLHWYCQSELSVSNCVSCSIHQ